MAGRQLHPMGLRASTATFKIPKKPPVQNRGLLGGGQKTGENSFSVYPRGSYWAIACIIVPLSATSNSGRYGLDRLRRERLAG